MSGFDISGHSGVDHDGGNFQEAFVKQTQILQTPEERLLRVTFFQLQDGYMLGLFHAFITPA
jgi:hypothetical protein